MGVRWIDWDVLQRHICVGSCCSGWNHFRCMDGCTLMASTVNWFRKKTADSIEMPFVVVVWVCPNSHVLWACIGFRSPYRKGQFLWTCNV